MGIRHSAATIWHNKAGRLTVVLVIACMLLAGFAAYRHHSHIATDRSAAQTNATGSAMQGETLPVTTAPSAPDTSPINAPGNSGQNIQSQPDSTPSTASPQQAAPTSPDQVNEPVSSQPVQPAPAPTPSGCGTCGGGGFRKTQIACPMYCIE